MKTIFTLFVATIVLLSCNNNVKEIEIDRTAGEWVSSGAKYVIGSDEKVVIVKKLIENPQFENRQVYCERSDTQKNCKPLVIVENVTDFQVVLKDVNGVELTSVGLSAADAIANQDKVHTAEIYVTVRSANELYKTNKITKMLNHNVSTQKNDQYHRETFFLSVFLRNLTKI